MPRAGICGLMGLGVGASTQVCLDIQGLEALTDIWVMGTQKICPRMQSWKQQEMY